MSDALKTASDRYSADDIAAYYDAGFWQTATFFEMLTERATTQPDDVFVFDSTTSLTYAQLRDQALRLAVGFKRNGVGAGDRIVVQLPNWTEFPLVVSAANRIGAIVVPVMPIYRGDEVGYVLDHSGAVAVVSCGTFHDFDHAAMFAHLRSQASAVRNVWIAREDQAGLAGNSALADLFVEGETRELEAEVGPDTSPDSGFVVVYTSGTSARPKGCFHTVNTIRASALAIRKSIDYTRDDVQFGPSPITHSTGIVISLMLPLLVGAKSYLMEVFEPREALARIKEYGCTGAMTATPFLQMLMAAYDPHVHDASSLRYWICAGSPIPGSVVTRSRELFTGCHTLSLYGRSENYLSTMCTITDDPERSATSDGRALAGSVIQIVDENGDECARGEEGDIAYKGPSHMLEYFRNDEATAALFTPAGFSRSGDLGRMDERGFIRVTGRSSDIVIRGGMNISAREVEDHLLQHPLIANVAVVGMPDDRLGEKVCAYVVLSDAGDSLTLPEVSAYLREHGVAVQKVPERLEVVTAFPMTATGKVQKHVLRATIAAKMRRDVDTAVTTSR